MEKRSKENHVRFVITNYFLDCPAPDKHFRSPPSSIVRRVHIIHSIVTTSLNCEASKTDPVNTHIQSERLLAKNIVQDTLDHLSRAPETHDARSLELCPLSSSFCISIWKCSLCLETPLVLLFSF